MRIKKSELKDKSAPQIPINYPAPERINEIDFAKERDIVEKIATRLADNEVDTRDRALNEVPHLLRTQCQRFKNFINTPLPATDSTSTNHLSAGADSYDEDTQFLEAVFEADGAAELSINFDKLNLGLFFCLWHSDKPLVQLACADRMASLVKSPTSPAARWLFVRSMFRMLVTSWPKIDKNRMDKYLAFVRRLVCACIEVVRDDEAAEIQALIASHNNVNTSRSGAVNGQKISTKKRARGRNHESAAEANKVDDSTQHKIAAVPPSVREAMMKAVTDEAICAMTSPLTFGASSGGVSLPPVAGYSSSSARMFALIIQREVVSEPISKSAIGLTLHIADILLTELMRPAAVRIGTMVCLASQIGLYTLSKGNFVEKRIMDNMIAPLAAGTLSASTAEYNASLNPPRMAVHGVGFDRAVSISLAHCAKYYATSKRTKFNCRALLTEAQRLLEDHASTLDLAGDINDADEENEMLEVETNRSKIKRIRGEFLRVEKAKLEGLAAASESLQRRKALAKAGLITMKKRSARKASSSAPKKSARHGKRWRS